MALSNMNKEVVTRLMQMISAEDNRLDDIKGDHAAYAKLSLLASQMQMLQEQARSVIAESNTNARLQSIGMTTKKVPGTVYHLYTQNSRQILSIISPAEWNMYEDYHGAFLYDFDHIFKHTEK